MIEAVMYGMIPSANSDDPRQTAAGEAVQQAEDAAAVVVLDVVDGIDVDARNGDERPQPVDRQDRHREQDLVADLRDPER